MARVTVLVENTATGRGLLAEHGLSCWIEHGARRVLFDTGQGYVARHNARQLGIPLETVNAVVLSHGHFDHTRGLGDILRIKPSATLFCHPDALASRYVRQADGTAREIGMPPETLETVKALSAPIWTTSPTEICPDLHVTGPIPRQTSFEDCGGAFFLDASCERPDLFPDDQALYLETERGTWVILGCAHSGLINTLRYVLELTANRPILGVIGGTHLVSASPERMNHTVDALRQLGIQRLMPAHCTGFFAMARLWREFPEGYAPCAVGTVIDTATW